jgi:putative acetyltransferase
MEVDIREATPDDALAVRDVDIASIEGLGPSAYDPEVVAAWAHDRDPAEYPITADDSALSSPKRGNSSGSDGWRSNPVSTSSPKSGPR